MSDLVHVLPAFPTRRFSHLLPSLERHRITTVDLLTLDPLEVARRARIPVLDTRQLADHVLALLQGELGLATSDGAPATGAKVAPPPAANDDYDEPPPLRSHGDAMPRALRFVSTLDPALDAALGGGVPTGHLVEIAGDSGAGKTQLLMQLLLAAQLPPPHGLGRASLYLTTEHPLAVRRLRQMRAHHPLLLRARNSSNSNNDSSGDPPAPSEERILTLSVLDLEAQEHILATQLGRAVRRHRVGLVVVDSIASNYRAEGMRGPDDGGGSAALGVAVGTGKGADLYKARSASLVRQGTLLRELARTADCAVVVANQVTDWFPGGHPASALARPLPHHPYLAAGSSPRSSPTAAASSLPPPSSGPPPATPPTTVGPVARVGGALPRRPAHEADRQYATDPVLRLDHQQRFLAGWGDRPGPPAADGRLRAPTLGLVWANQIAARVVLARERVWAGEASRGAPAPPLPADAVRRNDEAQPAPSTDANADAGGRDADADDDDDGVDAAEWAPRRWRRWAKVVFAAWAPAVGLGGRGLEYEIWAGGWRSVASGGGGDEGNTAGMSAEGPPAAVDAARSGHGGAPPSKDGGEGRLP